MATYVLLHAAWAGGWQWRSVATLLRNVGHEVFTPTLTGLGERAHLACPEVGLDTHVQDVLGVLEYEELDDLVLVGHSYSGMVITAVAEHLPEQIDQLVYLDAFVPQDGQSLNDILGPDLQAHFVRMARRYGKGWRVPHDPPGMPRTAKRTDQPLKTGTQPVEISTQLQRCCRAHTSPVPGSHMRGRSRRSSPRLRCAHGPQAGGIGSCRLGTIRWRRCRGNWPTCSMTSLAMNKILLVGDMRSHLIYREFNDVLPA